MKKEHLKQPKEKKLLINFVKYSNIPFQMMAVIGLGLWAGISLDKWAELDFPIFTFCFAIFSVVIAVYVAIKDFIKK